MSDLPSQLCAFSGKQRLVTAITCGNSRGGARRQV